MNNGKEVNTIEFDLSQLADKETGLLVDNKYNLLWGGDKVASIWKDGTIKVQKANGTNLLNLKGYKENLIFSPDNQKIAFINENKEIEIWNILGKEQTKLEAKSYATIIPDFDFGDDLVVFFDKFFFSPNSKMIVASYTVVTGKGAKQPKDWNFESGKNQRRFGTVLLSTNDSVILNNISDELAFSPDGKLVAFSSNGYVDFWSILARRKLTTTISSRADMRFISDSKAMIYSKDDEILFQNFNFNPDQLVALGCDWLKDYLTNNPTVSESDRKMCGITSKK